MVNKRSPSNHLVPSVPIVSLDSHVILDTSPPSSDRQEHAPGTRVLYGPAGGGGGPRLPL